MKQKIIFILFTGLLIISCRAQMVQTVSDVPKLETNKAQFIGKPLKNLLAEIKLEIKSCMIQEGGGEQISRLRFFFSFQSKNTGNIEEKIKYH